MHVVLRWVKDRWVIGNYDLKRALSPIVSTAQKSGCVEKHFLRDLYPSKITIYAFLVFISESMQTLFLFNMRRKGKWKMPKVDLKWISSFLLPQYNLVCQKIMFTLACTFSAMSLEMWLPLVARNSY